MQQQAFTDQLFIEISGEVPNMDGTTLITDYQSRLVGVETHTVHWRINLKHPLTLLSMTSNLQDNNVEER